MDEKMREIEEAIKRRTQHSTVTSEKYIIYVGFEKALLSKIKELEPDALYLRKWREIKGSNPYLPCACQIDDDTGKLISQCQAHKEIIGTRDKIIEKLKDHISLLTGEYSDSVIKNTAKIKELEERIELAEVTRDDALAYAKMYKGRMKELEEGIEGVLNQKDLISFAIQKQLEGLIGGRRSHEMSILR
jgi:hypothetical protein